MIDHVINKLDLKNILNHFGHSLSKIHYITNLEDSPEHIRYRYTAFLGDEKKVIQVGLELVTLIDNDYVPFKEIFVFHPSQASSYDSTILEHVNLFLDLIHTRSSVLIVE